MHKPIVCLALLVTWIEPAASQDRRDYKKNMETIKSDDSSRDSKLRALENLARSVQPKDAVQSDFNLIDEITRSSDIPIKNYAIQALRLYKKEGAERLVDIIINSQKQDLSRWTGHRQAYQAAAYPLMRMKDEAGYIAPRLCKVITRAVEQRLPEIGNAFPGGERYEDMVKVLKELDTGDEAVIKESEHWIKAATAMGNSSRRATCSFIGSAANVGMQYVKKQPEKAKDLIPTLIALLNVRNVDRTWGAVPVACEALGAMGANAKDAIPSLRNLLNSRDSYSQKAAEKALKQIRQGE